jgi:hypothetical protein
MTGALPTHITLPAERQVGGALMLWRLHIQLECWEECWGSMLCVSSSPGPCPHISRFLPSVGWVGGGMCMPTAGLGGLVAVNALCIVKARGPTHTNHNSCRASGGWSADVYGDCTIGGNAGCQCYVYHQARGPAHTHHAPAEVRLVGVNVYGDCRIGFGWVNVNCCRGRREGSGSCSMQACMLNCLPADRHTYHASCQASGGWGWVLLLRRNLPSITLLCRCHMLLASAPLAVCCQRMSALYCAAAAAVVVSLQAQQQAVPVCVQLDGAGAAHHLLRVCVWRRQPPQCAGGSAR